MISIIIPTLNAQPYIRRALDSVLLQSYRDIEIIIVDGGSQDNTVSIVKSVADSRISLIQLSTGIYGSINIGLIRSSKPWIYIMGADDYLWSRCVLSRVAEKLTKDGDDFRVAYGAVAYVSRDGKLLQNIGAPWALSKTTFISRMSIPHQGVFHHRSLFGTHGLFDESFKYAGDYDLLLRELKKSDPLFMSDIIVAAYQHGGGSSTPKNALRVWREYRRAQLKNGFPLPTINFLMGYCRTALRVLVWRVFGARVASRIDDFFRDQVGLPKIWVKNQSALQQHKNDEQKL